MSFSVLLSLYKKENPLYLRESLNSILGQTLPPDEIVLVLDGPLTKELESVVKEYAKHYPLLKIVPLSENVGLGRALHEGMKHCSNELIARMDTDDVAKPDRFEKQFAIFTDYPDVDVCGAWIEEFVGSTHNVKSIKKVPEKHWEILRYAQKRCPINHPVVMFRKTALMSAGGYCHFLLEDYLLWVKMLMDGAKFYNIQESLLWFRSSSDMFARRGGLRYLKNEIDFWVMACQRKFVSFPRMCVNIMVRIPVRLSPNRLRKWVYSFLRK